MSREGTARREPGPPDDPRRDHGVAATPSGPPDDPRRDRGAAARSAASLSRVRRGARRGHSEGVVSSGTGRGAAVGGRDVETSEGADRGDVQKTPRDTTLAPHEPARSRRDELLLLLGGGLDPAVVLLDEVDERVARDLVKDALLHDLLADVEVDFPGGAADVPSGARRGLSARTISRPSRARARPRPPLGTIRAARAASPRLRSNIRVAFPRRRRESRQRKDPRGERCPKSASAISPGPLTMQPMTAMVTPGRWPVASEMRAVTCSTHEHARAHSAARSVASAVRTECARGRGCVGSAVVARGRWRHLLQVEERPSLACN